MSEVQTVKGAPVINKLVIAALFAVACTANVQTSDTGDSTSPSSGGGGKGDNHKPLAGDGTDDDPLPPGVDVPLQYAPAGVRRLTPSEVQNSIRDIFLGGAEAAPLKLAFAREVRRHDFDNNKAYLDASFGFVENVQTFSEAAAAVVVTRIGKLLPCAAAPTDETKCATQFISTFAPQTFRRPVTSEEQKRLLDEVYKPARTRVGFAEALGIVVEAMVQSPKFLFRSELGQTPGEGGVARLDDYEVASELSYFIWRSTPDAQLLAAAADGKLRDAAGRKEQAKRLLADPRAREGLRDFFMQLLEVEQLGAGLVNKTDPAFNEALAKAMFEETSRFMDDVLWKGDGTFATLLRQPATFVNGPLATLYGLSTKPTNFTRVDLDPTRRAGFLTQPAFISVMTSPSGFNPIFLGLFVRRKLFCQTLANPPDDIPQVPKDPNLTTRERFAAHSSAGACQGCHRLLDPVGFGFERYDALGRYRTEEKIGDRMVPLDGKGQLQESDVDGSFTGPVELAKRLSESSLVRQCLTTQLMRFAVGRDIVEASNRVTAETYGIETVAKSSAASVSDMLVELVNQDAFFKRDARALSGGI